MILIKSGNIPTEVVYAITAPGAHTNIKTNSIVYVAEASNKETIATALTRRGKVGTSLTRKNDPISNLKIIECSHKSAGGSIWRCSDELNRVFEIREDGLLELMQSVGISNGILGGEYVWARVGNGDMRLVRVGSDLHASLTKSSERKTSSFLKKKEITPGTIYQQKNGEVFLYVGFCTGLTPEPNVSSYDDFKDKVFKRWYDWAVVVGSKDSWAKEQYLRTWQNLDQPPYPKRIEVSYKKHTSPLWVKLSWDEHKSPEENISLLEKNKQTLMMTLHHASKRISWPPIGNCLRACSFVEDKKVIKSFGKLDISNICEQIRELALIELMEDLKSQEDRLKVSSMYENHKKDRILKERNRLKTVGDYMNYGTINPEGQEMDPSYDYWISEIISREPA